MGLLPNDGPSSRALRMPFQECHPPHLEEDLWLLAGLVSEVNQATQPWLTMQSTPPDFSLMFVFCFSLANHMDEVFKTLSHWFKVIHNNKYWVL